MPRKEINIGPISAQAQQDLVTEGIENFELPRTVVQRLAKASVPDNVKLQKETVLSLQKGSTVFINYLAATAHDVALSKQHKSISASDVFKALEMIQFGDLVGVLQADLQAYRELAKNDKSMKGSANISAASAAHKGKSVSTASAPTSVSAASKSKGKEREKTMIVPSNLPPPFTTMPLNATSPPHVFASVSTGAMEVDEENVTANTNRSWEAEEEEEEGEDVDIPRDMNTGPAKEVALRGDGMELDELDSATGTPHTVE